MAAAPTLATVTPAIWGLVRTGFATAAAAATAEDEVVVAAAAELVQDVDDVVEVAFSPTPPDAAFVVGAWSKEDTDLGKAERDPVAVAITVLVPNAALDATGKVGPEKGWEERLLLLVGVVRTPSVADSKFEEAAVSVECVFGLAP